MVPWEVELSGHVSRSPGHFNFASESVESSRSPDKVGRNLADL
jgi:hypothetical protein